MTSKESIRLSIDNLLDYRQQMKDQLGEAGYHVQLHDFTTNLQNVDRPAGVTYIEVADIVYDRIDQNPELSEEAKDIGKVMYSIAAVELMGIDEFIDWMLS